MSTLEFLSFAFTLACMSGVGLGVLFLLVYRWVVRVNRRGFGLFVGLPPQGGRDE